MLSGRRRPVKPVVEMSDDEDEGEEEPKPDWTRQRIDVSEATRAIAIKWLRTARARVMAGGGAGGGDGGGGGGAPRSTRTASRKPGEKATKSAGEKKDSR